MENWLTHFGTELLGSMLLIVLGNGVVANVILKGTKGYKATTFLIIALGWGFAVAIGALVSSSLGGRAHLNPAVSFAFVVNNWTTNVGSWNLLPIILVGQILGFLVGQILVDLVYFQQIRNYFKNTKDDFQTNACQGVLGMHATIPQGRIVWSNFLMEFLGTTVLIVAILAIGKIKAVGDLGFVGPLLVMLVVMGVGCSLSGTTGYAINPFRDLIPRITYQILILLPFANKKETADWKYAWIPVIAPIMAGVIVGACFLI